LARTRAIQSALGGATVVPLDTLRAAAEALDLGRVVAEHGNRAAASDAAVAIGLLKAAADGAAANVRTNLAGLKDEGLRKATEEELSRLSEQAAAHAATAFRSTSS
jgi:formiminotetrahydrofolate cyclodeaminase